MRHSGVFSKASGFGLLFPDARKDRKDRKARKLAAAERERERLRELERQQREEMAVVPADKEIRRQQRQQEQGQAQAQTEAQAQAQAQAQAALRADHDRRLLAAAALDAQEHGLRAAERQKSSASMLPALSGLPHAESSNRSRPTSASRSGSSNSALTDSPSPSPMRRRSVMALDRTAASWSSPRILTPVPASDSCASSPTAFPAQENPVLASYISARRRAPKSSSPGHGYISSQNVDDSGSDSEVDSATHSMSSSMLFYNPVRVQPGPVSPVPAATESATAIARTRTTGVTSPVPSAYSAYESLTSRNRFSMQSSTGASDTDAADYATADEGEPGDDVDDALSEFTTTRHDIRRLPTPPPRVTIQTNHGQDVEVRSSLGPDNINLGGSRNETTKRNALRTNDTIEQPAVPMHERLAPPPSDSAAESEGEPGHAGTFGYTKRKTGRRGGRHTRGSPSVASTDSSLFVPPPMPVAHEVATATATVSSAEAETEGSASTTTTSGASNADAPKPKLLTQVGDNYNVMANKSDTNWFYQPTLLTGNDTFITALGFGAVSSKSGSDQPRRQTSASSITSHSAVCAIPPLLGRRDAPSVMDDSPRTATATGDTLAQRTVSSSPSQPAYSSTMSTTSLRPPSLSAVSGARMMDRAGMSRSSSRNYSKWSRARAKLPSTASRCSECDSEESDCSSDAGEEALPSPRTPFDSPPFVIPTTNQWGIPRSATFPPVAETLPETGAIDAFGSPASVDMYPAAAAEGDTSLTAVKRSSETPSTDSSLPSMSISASSNATSELRTPRQSLGLDSPQDVEEEDDEEEEKEAPDDLPSMRIGSMPPKDIMSAATLRSSATLDVPIAQFARASFGCDSGDAERERARILSAIEDEGSYEGGDTERVRSIHSVYEHAHAHTQVAEKDAPTSSDGSECDSDLETSGDDQHAQDEEVATMQSRARADFFGAGSASARAARRSHASLNSLPANHELEHDLSHLRSSLLPTFRARVSLTSVDRANTDDSSTPTHSRPHSFSVSRQNSLSNLARRHEAALGRTSVLSHKSLSVRWSQDTTPLPILEEQKFHVSNPTSQRRMWEAATSFLFDEDGNAICFGDLLPKTVDDDIEEEEKDSDGALRAPSTSGPPPRAVVFFIRSFWCGLCQDYTLASIARLDPQVLKKHNVSVAVIGPGHWKILKPYRELFKCPFPFYTDPTRKLYRAMGMTKSGTSMQEFSKHRPQYHQGALPTQAVKGVARGVRHMPLGYNIGNLFQLGGEFVLGAGYRCEFAHRMTYFGDHMDAREVLKHAGVDHPAITPVVLTEAEQTARDELDDKAQNGRKWQEERDRVLDRMQRKKVARRRFGSSLIDLDSIILTEPQQRKSDLDDDTRSEWNDYVHSWLQPNRLSTASRSNPSSGVGTPSLVNDSTHSLRAECGLSGVSAFSTASPDPTEPFILTPPPATESPGRIMPSPLVIPSVPNSPTLRVLSSQDDPRQLLGLGLGSPVGPRSPKPPLRRPLGPRPNVISPTRKAVPVLTPEDEDEMRKEEARRSLVLI